MKFGDFHLRTVSGGSFRLDGGAMFGVVPKLLWQKVAPADQWNRIRLETNCLLIESTNQKILVDTGYGSKLSPKRLQQIDGQAGNPIVDNLDAIGISPEEINTLIFTHLHFDHACGATKYNQANELVPVFPNARHIVQRLEWEDATSDKPELAGTYERPELLVIKQSGLLELVDEDHEVFAGISLHRTGGHTRGHQIVKIDSLGERATYLGDICPTAAHLKTFWGMGYDLFPGDVRCMKPEILQSLVDTETILLFDHDPNMQGARLLQTEEHKIIIQEEILL